MSIGSRRWLLADFNNRENRRLFFVFSFFLCNIRNRLCQNNSDFRFQVVHLMFLDDMKAGAQLHSFPFTEM